MVDLVEMKAYIYNDDLGKDISVESRFRMIMKEKAEEYHQKLIEAAAEQDEEMYDEIPGRRGALH